MTTAKKATEKAAKSKTIKKAPRPRVLKSSGPRAGHHRASCKTPAQHTMCVLRNDVRTGEYNGTKYRSVVEENKVTSPVAAKSDTGTTIRYPHRTLTITKKPQPAKSKGKSTGKKTTSKGGTKDPAKNASKKPRTMSKVDAGIQSGKYVLIDL